MKSKGVVIGNRNILIAGICVSNSLPLLTRNAARFSRVKDLVLYEKE